MGPKTDMLITLTVRQLAVVEDLSLTFKSGMTSLTGETGAGKSILVDALGLVLGDRADSNMVRHGSERAEIEASFDISNNLPLQQWLKNKNLMMKINVICAVQSAVMVAPKRISTLVRLH